MTITKLQRNLFYFAIGMLVRYPRVKSALSAAEALDQHAWLKHGPTSTPARAAIHRYMLYFMLPLWFIPGVLDWWMHRRTEIEKNAGWRESMIHSLMMAETGIPIIAGLLLEMNAGMLAFMIIAFLLHSATAVWDVTFAVNRREIRPIEQHIHSFLEVLPFCAASLVVCLHWDQFLALIGKGPEKPEFYLRLKNPPISPQYFTGICAAILLFIALPYGEEMIRCLQAIRADNNMDSARTIEATF